MPYLGATCRFKLTITDEANVAIDPDEQTITIYNPANTPIDVSGDEVKDSTGIYFLDYTFLINAGIWRLVWKVVKAGKARINVMRIVIEDSSVAS